MESAISRQRNLFILSVMNALLDKAGETCIWIVVGVRFLDMQLQEHQYIHVLVIIVNSYHLM